MKLKLFKEAEEELKQFPQMNQDFLWFLNNRKSLTQDCITPIIKNNQKVYGANKFMVKTLLLNDI